MNSRRHMQLLVVASVSALVLAACGRNDAASHLASAKSHLEKADVNAAIIELRNAREKAPDSAEVRFLLGKALLERGEPGPAEIELRKAESLKYPADSVQPLLAQAFLAQGEVRKVTTEFAKVNLQDAKGRADLAASLAVAYLSQGDIGSAKVAAETALSAQPGHPRALVVRAQLLAVGGDLQGAVKALDEALVAAPRLLEATLLKAQILVAQGEHNEAIKIIESSVSAAKSVSLATQLRSALIPLLLSVGKVPQAETEVAAMKKAAPKDSRTTFAEAQVALAKRDYAKARDATQVLLGARPDHLPSLYLSGLANYGLKSWGAAEDALARVVKQAPGSPDAQRALVLTYLRSGRGAEAVEAVDVALRRLPDDPMLLRLAGEAQALSGNVLAALKYFERAASLEKSGSAARVRLAQARLAQGDAARAISDLEGLAAADPASIQADLTLYAAHLSRRQYDKALAVVENLEKKQPGALAHELRGNVMLARRDYAAARTSFAKALEMQPTRLSAARRLAGLDLLENKPADARARYEKMIVANPRSEHLQIALAETLALSGASTADVKAALDKAIAANPTSPRARLALLAHMRQSGDLAGALTAANAANSALPGDQQLLEALGALQFANAEYAQALETFVQLAKLQPNNPAPQLRIAETYLVQKDYRRAIDAQRKALAIQPDYTPALLALAATEIAAGKPEEALAEAKRIQKERPDASIGYALEGEILAVQRRFPEAASTMREALAKRPTSALAARQYSLLMAAGRKGDASAFAQRWTKDHPKDASFLSLVGQQLQAAKDVAGATTAYRAALAIDPENVVVLNNLAWLLNEQGNREAKELAERAHRLAPLTPSVIDTYGTILLAQGEIQRGIAMLRMATNLAPNDVHLRVNFARALLRSGDKASAKRELEAVLARDPRPSPAQIEAEALLKSL